MQWLFIINYEYREPQIYALKASALSCAEPKKPGASNQLAGAEQWAEQTTNEPISARETQGRRTRGTETSALRSFTTQLTTHGFSCELVHFAILVTATENATRIVQVPIYENG